MKSFYFLKPPVAFISKLLQDQSPEEHLVRGGVGTGIRRVVAIRVPKPLGRSCWGILI